MRAPLTIALVAFSAGCHGGEPLLVVQQPTCAVETPPDGATDVAVDTPIVVANVFGSFDRNFGCGEPTLTRDDGVAVATEVAFDPSMSRAVLTPRDALDADRTYTLDFGVTEPFCGEPHRATFRTGPAPALRRVDFRIDSASRWYGQRTIVAGLGIALSEPVADVKDLDPARGFVTVSLPDDDEPAFAIRLDEGAGVTIAEVAFDAGEQEPVVLPRYEDPIRVRLSKGLRFASGASLAEDVVFEASASDYPFGWKPGARKGNCEEDSQGGCASADATWLALLALLAGRRRRLL